MKDIFFIEAQLAGLRSGQDLMSKDDEANRKNGQTPSGSFELKTLRDQTGNFEHKY